MFSSFLRMIHGFVLIIGPKSAGKTSIIRRLTIGKFEETDPTLGYEEEYIAKARVIEIGGQSNFQEYWPIILEQEPVHVFYVIDVTQKSDYILYMEFSKTELEKLKKRNVSTTLCLNKSDLIKKFPTYIDLPDLSIICSAKNGEGMMDILEKIGQFPEKTNEDLGNLPDDNSLQGTKKSEEEGKKIKSLKEEFEGKF